MEKMWKKWDTPHIIVILRNNPEEMILSVCKGGGGISAPNAVDGDCYQECSSCPSSIGS